MKRVTFLLLIGVVTISVVSLAGNGMEDQPVGRFTGVYSHKGSDENGDGYYDYLLVETEVEVDSAGSYTMYGILVDEDGKDITWAPYHMPSAIGNRITVDCDSGLNTFAMRFSGEDIRNHGADGVYCAQLSLRLGDCHVDTEVRCSSYVHTDFRETVAAILGPVLYRGVDTTGDGRYDYFETQVEFEIVSTGYFDVKATLTGRTNSGASQPFFIGDDQVIDTLFAGLDTVKFVFNVRSEKTSKDEEVWNLLVEFHGDQTRFPYTESFEIVGYRRSDF